MNTDDFRTKSMTLILPVLICVHLWLLPTVHAQLNIAPPPSTQSGVVRANGVPIPGATIRATLGDKSLVTVTDDNGNYKLDGLTDGAWVIEVQMFGFEPQKKEVKIAGPVSLEWNLTLKHFGPAAPATAVAKTTTPAAPKPGPQPAAQPAKPGAQGAQSGTQVAQRGRGQQGAAGGQQGGRGPLNGQRGSQNGRGAQNGQQGGIPELSGALDGQVAEAANGTAAELPGGVQTDNANEAFLVNGSLSQGLQQINGDPGGMGPGFGRGGPGGFGEGCPGGFGGPGAAGFGGGDGGGQAVGGGRGGPGGGFGGPGGGGFGGGRGGGFPGGGGRGGPGGRGGQNMAGGRRGPNNTDAGMIGNRRNRGQQGLHGMAQVVLGNSLLDARPFAVNGQAVAKPSYSRERYNFQIGGPLMIPKLFRLDKTTFNLSYTGNRSDNFRSQVGTVPTLLERQGDFSQSGSIIYDPTVHAPFSDNKILINQQSQIALGLLSYFPKPNQPGLCVAGVTACNSQNYQFSSTVPNNNNNLGLRIGQSLSRKDRLSVNFQFQNRSSVSPQIFGFLDNSTGRGISTNLSWTHTFAPRVFNMASVNFNRNRNDMLPFFANGADVAAQLGIQGTSGSPINYGPPNLGFTNYAGLTDGSASLSRIQSTSLTDAFTWMRGKHSLSFGATFSRSQNNVQTDSNARGTFSFTGLASAAFDANGLQIRGTGYDFADFLVGLPQSSSIRFGDTSTYFRTTSYSFFGQDDWRWRPNLSFNFGLRYEYYGVPYEKWGHEANLAIAPGFTNVAVVLPGQTSPFGQTFPQGLVNPDRNNFAPRFGLAWRPWPKGKTTVRAGYGMYYNGGAYNGFMRNLSAQPPFANTNSVTTSTAALLTLANGFITLPSGKTIVNTYAVDPNYRIPYAQSWNVFIQRDLPGGLVLQVGYNGQKGTRLDTLRSPNRALPGSQLTAEVNRIIPYATAFTFESSDADSIMHSGSVSLNRRFRQGVSFQLNYVFSKSIDDTAAFGGGGIAQNDQNIQAERSLSAFDRRHTLNMNYVLTSPFGHNSRLLAGHQLAGKLLQDWNLSGNATAQTGPPLTAHLPGDWAGTGVSGTTRPNATGEPINVCPAGDSGCFFNPNAFSVQPSGQFGNAGRYTIPGPASVVLGASFGRSFGLGERRNLEFRVDASNILNHVNISSFGTTLNSKTYDLATAAGAMRTMSATIRFRF